MSSKEDQAATLLAEWTLPPGATLGSSVRAKGILLELRAKLPFKVRKALEIKGAVLTLRLPEDAEEAFAAAAGTIGKTLEGIESLPVIPREIQDILTITATERHRWLKDGRLKSAGTRTIKLRGRARKVTFHIFDPRYVEDLLDRDVVDAWREEDVERRAENRRLATEKRALTRKAAKASAAPKPDESPEEAERHLLKGWAEFERLGLLR